MTTYIPRNKKLDPDPDFYVLLYPKNIKNALVFANTCIYMPRSMKCYLHPNLNIFHYPRKTEWNSRVSFKILSTSHQEIESDALTS